MEKQKYILIVPLTNAQYSNGDVIYVPHPDDKQINEAVKFITSEREGSEIRFFHNFVPSKDGTKYHDMRNASQAFRDNFVEYHSDILQNIDEIIFVHRENNFISNINCSKEVGYLYKEFKDVSNSSFSKQDAKELYESSYNCLALTYIFESVLKHKVSFKTLYRLQSTSKYKLYNNAITLNPSNEKLRIEAVSRGHYTYNIDVKVFNSYFNFFDTEQERIKYSISAPTLYDKLTHSYWDTFWGNRLYSEDFDNGDFCFCWGIGFLSRNKNEVFDAKEKIKFHRIDTSELNTLEQANDELWVKNQTLYVAGDPIGMSNSNDAILPKIGVFVRIKSKL